MDVRQAVRTAMGSTATREEMVSAASRMVALTNILVSPVLKRWICESGKDQSTVDMAVLRVAARAPLFQTQRPADLAFDTEMFESFLLEESQPRD